MGNHEDILIKKASGKEEYFSFQKLRNSLIKSNATFDEAEDIVQSLKGQIHQGISTKKIYSMAFRLLKKQSNDNASRYYLKKGIMELGPSGFPFEKYIAELFKAEGYATENGVILQGNCVTHEIDVICRKEDTIMLMECKYKNIGGISVDVKVPLYIHSRFQDIVEHGKIFEFHKNFKGWIVTNSRFTEDALKFGKCRGINLLGWDYPKTKSLKDIIDETGLYPITCLASLTQVEKNAFLERGVVLARDICKNRRIFERLGTKTTRIEAIMKESEKLCGKYKFSTLG